MIKSLLTALVTFALALTGRAETSVKLTDVHLCCNACVKGVAKAVAPVTGIAAECDADAGTVTITAADTATAQKGVDALVAAGYFGKSQNSAIKLADTSGAKDAKVTMLTVEDVHLCCGKCVKAVDAAVSKVPGVTSHTAEKNAKTFEVKGDFNSKEVFAALQNAGLTGKAGK